MPIFLELFCLTCFKYQIDADTAVVGEEGEVDFKEDAKFARHMKEKGEAVSEFAKSKSLSQQRQYLPIYSVRDELLQVQNCLIHTANFCTLCHALLFKAYIYFSYYVQ